MLRFLLRRLLVAIPTLFLVVTLAFFMMRAAPGSPFDMERKLAPEVERNVMAKYGMNKPLGEQYVNYLKDAVRGDFGPSL
jgi:oligopeptide transport system permease protein